MLKRILIPLDTSEFTDSAIRIAAAMASQEMRAESELVTLVGLGLIDLDQIPTGRFASMVPREEIIKEAEEQIEKRVQDFKTLAASLGIKEDHIKTRVESGGPFRKIIHESVVCDMIVMGMRCSFPPINQDHESLSNIIHHSSRPVVIADKEFSKVERVLLVMDGTAPASRMIYAFALLNPMPMARVTMINSLEEIDKYPNLQGFFERAEGFLQEHHINIQRYPVDTVNEDTIAEMVKEEGSEMIALGVHTGRFLDQLRDPLNLKKPFVERLLNKTKASLFTMS